MDMMEQQTFIAEHNCLGRDKGKTVSGSGDTCCSKSKRPDLGGLALGQLLWAKAVLSSWWPAQIVDDRAVSENNIINQRIQGGVLVRFYGSYDFAWVNPLAELSQFEESFKGKCFNTRKAFQKALEDAMLQNKLNSQEACNGKSGCTMNPSQPNQPGSCIANSNGDFDWKLKKASKGTSLKHKELWEEFEDIAYRSQDDNLKKVMTKLFGQQNGEEALSKRSWRGDWTKLVNEGKRKKPAQKASSCKRKMGDEHEQSKGPRKRKEKVPFKEGETVPVASEQKGRRLKVMRHLGLVAPPGSPFSADSPVKIAA